MSLWIRSRPAPVVRAQVDTAESLIPPRTAITSRVGSVSTSREAALKHSAVWAACRLRADLISTLPIDTYRKVGNIDVEVPKPPIFTAPGGGAWDYVDWMWASQFDLDTCGNAVGLITERFANDLPARVELQPTHAVSVRPDGSGGWYWWIDGRRYEPEDVWHERSFPVPGFVLGLSPVAMAAWSVGEALSMQEFAINWFGGGGLPKAHLKELNRELKPGEAEVIEARYNATMKAGGVFVTGNNWDFNLLSAQQAGTEFIDGRNLTLQDIARFFGVPGDLIEAAAAGGSGGKINYANVTQRNLQFLIYHLGPAIIRRERRLSSLLPSPRFVKLNTDALLRMDAETREKVIRSKLESKQITITEAREIENRKPYTAAQEEEVEKWFGSAKATNDAAAAQGAPQDQPADQGSKPPTGGQQEEGK